MKTLGPSPSPEWFLTARAVPPRWSRAIEDGGMINLDTCAFANTIFRAGARRRSTDRRPPACVRSASGKNRDKSRRSVDQVTPLACPVDLRGAFDLSE